MVSETIDTHVYESKTLAKAFEEITGIKVKHDIIQEGDVIEKLQTQMQSGKQHLRQLVNDSRPDRHALPLWRRPSPLSDFMAGEGKDVTIPALDVDDFIGKSFTTAPDGKLYQLPDQQFANLYWFRADWFARQDLQGQVQGQVRLRAGRAGQLVGLRRHRRLLHQRREGRSTASACTATWTTARRTRRSAGASPTRGCRWRARPTRALPNGMPVDEWGIRVRRQLHTRSAPSVARGGDANSPAAVYALTKYIDWLKKYAPPEAAGHDVLRSRPGAGRKARSRSRSSGTPRSPPTLTKPGLPVVNADGTPKWRMAPSPHGPYWKEGMQHGYQDVRLVDDASRARRSSAARPRGCTRSS